MTEQSPTEFKWNYHLHNDSFVWTNPERYWWGIGYVVINVEDSSVPQYIGSNVTSDIGIDSGAGGSPINIYWNIGDASTPYTGLLPGSSGDFWYTTPPHVIDPQGGSHFEPAVADGGYGLTMASECWPSMDDHVVMPDTTYPVSTADAFEHIQTVILYLCKYPAAKALYDAAIYSPRPELSFSRRPVPG